MTEEFKQYARDIGLKIEESDIFMCLHSDSYKTHPETALQLGIAILTGKPIAVIALPGSEVSAALKRLAFMTETVQGTGDIEAAVKRILQKLDQGKDVNATSPPSPHSK